MPHQTDINSLYDLLQNSTFCIGVKTIDLYFLFLKGLIKKFLDDAQKNYLIYVVTENKFLNAYHNNLEQNDRIQYINGDFIPVNIPNNTHILYLYHKNTKHTPEQQIDLINCLKSYPMLKYVFVGRVDLLLTSFRINMFKYFLFFNRKESKWGHSYGKETGFISNRKYIRFISRYYYHQSQARKNKTNSKIISYDYFLLYDFMFDTTSICKFNKKIIRIKPKRVETQPITQPITQPTTQPITQPTTQPVVSATNSIKKIYVYSGPRNSNFLTFPDGSRENFKSIVDKYQNIIEI